MKKVTGIMLAAALVFSLAGGAVSVGASSYVTVNGVTKGDHEVSTTDMGSASFNVEGNHVEMTNFTFDADPSLKVQADISEEDLVYAQAVVHDGENVMQNIADGHYPEVITMENAAAVFNRLYQKFLLGTDEPVVDGVVYQDTGVLVAQLDLTDGKLFMLAKNETDQYILIALTTSDYGTQGILDAAFDALKDESAADADGTNAADAEDTEGVEEKTYPVYSHETDDPYYLPACRYIMETYGAEFEPSDIMLPYVNVLKVDDSDPEDIKVWGNFRVFNYAKRGTTLMTRSGGNFPGMIHMKKDGDSYVGTSMDLVESGSDNAASIEKIFGVDDKLMEAFRASNDDEAINEIVLNTIRWYSEDTGIEIEAFEDYGWDPEFIDPDAAKELEYPDLQGNWTTDGATLELHNPEDGSVYEAIILADQDDGSKIKYTLYGQYEFSTGALYYWDGWMTRINGDEEEELGTDATGYLGLENDGTIAWYSANDGTEVWFERAE